MLKRPPYLCTNSVTFAEKPASPDEVAIADLIKEFHRALVTKDIDATLALFIPNAEMRSVRYGWSARLDKKFYAKHFYGLETVSIENIFIRVTGPSEAFASHDLILRYSGGVVKYNERRVWTFKKISGTWRIAAIELDNT